MAASGSKEDKGSSEGLAGPGMVVNRLAFEGLATAREGFPAEALQGTGGGSSRHGSAPLPPLLRPSGCSTEATPKSCMLPEQDPPVGGGSCRSGYALCCDPFWGALWPGRLVLPSHWRTGRCDELPAGQRRGSSARTSARGGRGAGAQLVHSRCCCCCWCAAAEGRCGELLEAHISLVLPGP